MQQQDTQVLIPPGTYKSKKMQLLGDLALVLAQVLLKVQLQILASAEQSAQSKHVIVRIIVQICSM